MGPIEKKILELSKTEGLSEETLMVLNLIKKHAKENERIIVNDAYQKGFHDKEMSRRPTWNYFDRQYKCYFSNM
jgi:cell division FtsZ-interacting protein ZapD